jgi:hypothetical protein
MTSLALHHELPEPTVVDARAALERVFGAAADQVWTELVGIALGGRTDRAVTVGEVVATMLLHRHGVVRLCGRALDIRVRTWAYTSGGSAAS